jgi:hypothetical protein
MILMRLSSRPHTGLRLRSLLILAVAICAVGIIGWTGARAGLSDRAGSFRAADAASAEVDVELVLAVDVSYSMDPDEQHLQREGYVEAFRSREFLDALAHGAHGRIAVTYIEWAGVDDQKTLMPWRLIDSAAAANAVADELSGAPYRRAYRTSISGGLRFAVAQFASSGYRGVRRVIDVSGDGANNQGPPVTIVRDQIVGEGITINGLPIMVKAPVPGSVDIDNLDVYYEDCVMGGPQAFVIPVKETEQFKQATRTKIVIEIANRESRPIPVASATPRMSCTIGERLWQQHWGDGVDFN